MGQFGLLYLGIACLGFTLGFLTGASATPVAGVAVPAIFGLVAVAVGLAQSPLGAKELTELVKAKAANDAGNALLASARKHLPASPARIGMALIAFSVFYLAGTAVGSLTRIDDWLAGAPRPAEAFAWSASKQPPPCSALAIEWVGLQGLLSARGYSAAQIGELYAIQAQEWARNPPACAVSAASRAALAAVPPKPAAAPAPPLPAASASAGGDVPVSGTGSFDQWLRETRPEGRPPVADMPKKKSPTDAVVG